VTEFRRFRRGATAIVAVALLTSACSSAAESGSSASQPTSERVVAFIPGELANPSQAYAWKMVQKQAADSGFKPIVLDGKADIQEQVKAINNAVAQQVSAILVNPNDALAIVPALTAAKAAGVCVGITMAKAAEGTDSSVDFWVAVQDPLAGKTAADAIMAKFPNGATGVEIGGQAGHPAAIDRHDGFAAGIEGKPIKVLEYKNPQKWDTAQAQAIAEDMITKYGDQIQFIFVHWDNGATGVINALKAKGGLDDVLIIGVDGNKTGFDQVKSWPNYISIGQNVETIMGDALKDSKLCADKDPSLKLENVIPFDVITKENVDTFTVPEW